MEAVASAVDILAEGAFEAEDAVERFGAEEILDGCGEVAGAGGAEAGDFDGMEMDAVGGLVPVFGVEMDFVVGGGEGAEESLEVEFGAAGGREVTADEGEFHSVTAD